ncbi:MAG: type II toxin-antitoxin system RelE/ParE family toxin [Sandaracinaceae bacterium]|nr:type II toxin-antitoxin system RelE/ParE family toxin [Sandaracinaceae bacterium]
MGFRIHPTAARELDAAAAWYEAQEPGLGAAFLEAYAVKLVQALERPRSGSPYHAAGRRVEIRKFGLRRFPYTIFVAIADGDVTVVAVAHQRRRPGYWTKRLGRRS